MRSSVRPRKSHLDAQGKCLQAALGTCSAPIPQAHVEIAGSLVGTNLDDAILAEAAAAVARAVEPDADLHASADYRRHLAGVLARRVLVMARDEARGRP